MARSGTSESSVALNEFCCLFYGYETRCITCPLPKAVQDLFDDGTLRAENLRRFAKKKFWEQQQQHDWHTQANMEYQGKRVDLKWALQVLGFEESSPKKKSDIKKLFKVRAKQLHPDTGGDVEAFKRLVRAYEIALALFRPAV